jgi:hypothetical protein
MAFGHGVTKGDHLDIFSADFHEQSFWSLAKKKSIDYHARNESFHQVEEKGEKRASTLCLLSSNL